MPIPVLNLPKTLGTRPAWLPTGITLKRLRKWIQRIDKIADISVIEQCLYRLIKFNTVHYPVKSRLVILGILQQTLVELFKNEKQFVRAAINADEPDLTSLYHLDKLFEEFANGYKLVIHTLSNKASLNENESIQVQEAIYYCLKFLAQRLLLAYVQYASPPKGVWREINQIYRYAEGNELLYHIIDDPAPDSTFPVFYSGDFIYKRIVLVALAEPFRLLKDECLELYNLCSRWISACSLFHQGELSSRGEHVVDLADDFPPRYVTRDLSWHPLDGRLIDITEVISRVEKDLQRLLKNHATTMNEFELVDLEERQKRDMLFRVLDSYRGKPVRQTRRFILSDNIQFTMGINNCHFYLANKKQHTPYMDELKHTTNRVHQNNSHAGSFASLYKQALERDRSHKWHEHALENASQHNINPLGLAFSYQVPRYRHKQPLSVGEIIAYRSGNKPSRRWVIGTASWIRRKNINHENITYEIGIKNLARNGIPVSVRENNNKGLDNWYYRGLLIPKHVSHQQLRSLVVPALSFELNSELVLNMSRTVMYIRLVRMLASSNAYAQFEFDVL